MSWPNNWNFGWRLEILIHTSLGNAMSFLENYTLWTFSDTLHPIEHFFSFTKVVGDGERSPSMDLQNLNLQLHEKSWNQERRLQYVLNLPLKTVGETKRPPSQPLNQHHLENNWDLTRGRTISTNGFIVKQLHRSFKTISKLIFNLNADLIIRDLQVLLNFNTFNDTCSLYYNIFYITIKRFKGGSSILKIANGGLNFRGDII